MEARGFEEESLPRSPRLSRPRMLPRRSAPGNVGRISITYEGQPGEESPTEPLREGSARASSVRRISGSTGNLAAQRCVGWQRAALTAVVALTLAVMVLLLFSSARMIPTSRDLGKTEQQPGLAQLNQSQQAVVLFTSRPVPALVLLRSLLAHSAHPGRLSVHVIMPDADCCVELLLFAQRNQFGSVSLYTLGELTLELLADGHAPTWTRKRAPQRKTVVRQADWDHDDKHGSPLNHARFYLPYMRFARDLDRLLFLDDDVVLQTDVLPALLHEMQPGKALIVSCNAINFDTCGWFRMAWDTITYAQTSYFGFKAFDVNGVKLQDAVCSDDAQKECIEPGGFELLSTTALRIGGAQFNLSEAKAWNFGYVVFDLRRWIAYNLTGQYDAWVVANAEEGIFAETSIGFGLGLPMLALAGRVQCFSDSVRILEGLAVMDRFDMAENNISLSQLDTAHVLHYTGELKPWLPEHYPEYKKPFSRYDSQLSSFRGDAGREKRLVVVLSGEHSGAEFLLASLEKHEHICAAGEGKGTLHMLRSFGRHGLMPPFPEMLADDFASDWLRPCSRQALCSWRHFARAITAPSELPGYALQGDIRTWRLFWLASGSNMTALFDGFMRATMGHRLEHAGAPLQLPCYCPAATQFIAFKFFSNWLLPSPLTDAVLAANPWADNLHGAAGSARALDVFTALNAVFIVIERSPVAAYFSLQKSLASGDWHCTTQSCLQPNTTLEVDAQACFNYAHWHRNASQAMDAQLARSGGAPALRLSFDECMHDQAQCMRMVTDTLGVAPFSDVLVHERVEPDVLLRGMVRNYDSIVESCGAAAV